MIVTNIHDYEVKVIHEDVDTFAADTVTLLKSAIDRLPIEIQHVMLAALQDEFGADIWREVRKAFADPVHEMLADCGISVDGDVDD